MKYRKGKYTKEGGQSLVEFVLTITFLTMLVAGVVDLGRAFFTYIALRDAAQEGAIFASIARSELDDPMACSDIINRARSTSINPIVDLSQANVEIIYYDFWDINLTTPHTCASLAPDVTASDNLHACFGSTIVVRVSMSNFPLVTPFMGTILGTQTISIQASIEDAILTPPCN